MASIMATFFIVKQPYASAAEANVLANKKEKHLFSAITGYLVVSFCFSFQFSSITSLTLVQFFFKR